MEEEDNGDVRINAGPKSIGKYENISKDANSIFPSSEWGHPTKFNGHVWSDMHEKNDDVFPEEPNFNETSFDEVYFQQDFEIPELDSIIEEDILNKEDNFINSVVEIAKIYQIPEKPIITFIIENWRSSQWDTYYSQISKSVDNDPWKFWNYIHNYTKNPTTEAFAKLAIKTISIPSSEAAVERVFSALRQFKHDHRINASSTLVEARMTYKIFQQINQTKT